MALCVITAPHPDMGSTTSDWTPVIEPWWLDPAADLHWDLDWFVSQIWGSATVLDLLADQSSRAQVWHLLGVCKPRRTAGVHTNMSSPDLSHVSHWYLLRTLLALILVLVYTSTYVRIMQLALMRNCHPEVSTIKVITTACCSSRELGSHFVRSLTSNIKSNPFTLNFHDVVSSTCTAAVVSSTACLSVVLLTSWSTCVCDLQPQPCCQVAHRPGEQEDRGRLPGLSGGKEGSIAILDHLLASGVCWPGR